MLTQKMLALGGGQTRDAPALLDEFTIDCKKEDQKEGHSPMHSFINSKKSSFVGSCPHSG